MFYVKCLSKLVVFFDFPSAHLGTFRPGPRERSEPLAPGGEGLLEVTDGGEEGGREGGGGYPMFSGSQEAKKAA